MMDSQTMPGGNAIPTHEPGPQVVQIGLLSDPGCTRDRNEDACLAWSLVLVQGNEPTMPISLFAVADGMGGHAHGRRASALALRLAAGHIIHQVSASFLADDGLYGEQVPINEILEVAVHHAHEGLLRRLPDSGTTLTLALLLGESLHLAHVGDSRAYLGRRGSLELLTEDHSLAARLLAVSGGGADEPVPSRNILYKAVGQGAEVEPDIVYRDLAPDQYLMLCCDGLWRVVPEGDMVSIVESARTPTSACRRLVARAKENGGEDNISIVLAALKWPLPDSRPSSSGPALQSGDSP